MGLIPAVAARPMLSRLRPSRQVTTVNPLSVSRLATAAPIWPGAMIATLGFMNHLPILVGVLFDRSSHNRATPRRRAGGSREIWTRVRHAELRDDEDSRASAARIPRLARRRATGAFPPRRGWRTVQSIGTRPWFRARAAATPRWRDSPVAYSAWSRLRR